MTGDWVADSLTSNFMLAASEMSENGDELIAEVKERMTRALADKLADRLVSASGGAIYSPVTFTIRELTEFGDYQVVGTIHVLEFPAPESGEARLIDGPMHGAVVKVGAFPPDRLPMPNIQPFLVSHTAKPEMVIYERVSDVQAYRWLRGG